MANTRYLLNHLGADFARRDTTPQFEIQTIDFTNKGEKAVYVQANGGIAASQSDITVSTAGQASDGSGTWSNSTAFSDDEYGWVWLVDNT